MACPSQLNLRVNCTSKLINNVTTLKTITDLSGDCQSWLIICRCLVFLTAFSLTQTHPMCRSWAVAIIHNNVMRCNLHLPFARIERYSGSHKSNTSACPWPCPHPLVHCSPFLPGKDVYNLHLTNYFVLAVDILLSGELLLLVLLKSINSMKVLYCEKPPFKLRSKGLDVFKQWAQKCAYPCPWMFSNRKARASGAQLLAACASAPSLCLAGGAIMRTQAQHSCPALHLCRQEGLEGQEFTSKCYFSFIKCGWYILSNPKRHKIWGETLQKALISVFSFSVFSKKENFLVPWESYMFAEAEWWHGGQCGLGRESPPSIWRESQAASGPSLSSILFGSIGIVMPTTKPHEELMRSPILSI